MKFLGNAFSLGMLSADVVDKVRIKCIESSDVPVDAKSCVGHADTARLFSKYLNREIKNQRITVTLNQGDSLFVGQLNGPRMPEGATELPEGASLRWFVVEIL